MFAKYSRFLRAGHYFIKTGKERLEKGVLDHLADDLPFARVWLVQSARDIDLCSNLSLSPPFEEFEKTADQPLVHSIGKIFLAVRAPVVNLHIPDERLD